jgi:hypothetical protein
MFTFLLQDCITSIDAIYIDVSEGFYFLIHRTSQSWPGSNNSNGFESPLNNGKLTEP